MNRTHLRVASHLRNWPIVSKNMLLFIITYNCIPKAWDTLHIMLAYCFFCRSCWFSLCHPGPVNRKCHPNRINWTILLSKYFTQQYTLKHTIISNKSTKWSHGLVTLLRVFRPSSTSENLGPDPSQPDFLELLKNLSLLNPCQLDLCFSRYNSKYRRNLPTQLLYFEKVGSVLEVSK